MIFDMIISAARQALGDFTPLVAELAVGLGREGGREGGKEGERVSTSVSERSKGGSS